MRSEVDTSANTEPQGKSVDERFRSVAIWCLLVMMVLILSAVFYAFVMHGHVEALWIPIAKEHFAAIVGLPMAALGSLCIVLILRISAGPIELEAWGVRFKGAAGPIVFWVLCFLAMTVAIKTLW